MSIIPPQLHLYLWSDYVGPLGLLLNEELHVVCHGNICRRFSLYLFFVLSMWILLLCLWDLIAFECVLWPVRLCLKRTHGETPSCADSAHVQPTAVAMATSGTLWSHFFFSLLDEINKASSIWLCDCMCTRALERACVCVCPREEKKKLCQSSLLPSGRSCHREIYSKEVEKFLWYNEILLFFFRLFFYFCEWVLGLIFSTEYLSCLGLTIKQQTLSRACKTYLWFRMRIYFFSNIL